MIEQQSTGSASPTGLALYHSGEESTMQQSTREKIDAVIARAQRAGSSATTLRGACRFLSALPAPRAGYTRYVMSAEDVLEYRYTRRGERICAGLGLPTDYSDRCSVMHSAVAFAAAHGAPAISPRLIGQLLSRHTWPAATIERYALNQVGLRSGLCATLDAAARAAQADLQSDWPLKKSQSSWAGGGHTVAVRWVLDPTRVGCRGGSERVWSDNGKWSGSNSAASLTVSVRALQQYPTLRTRDGQIVLDYEPIAGHPRTAKIAWVEQGRGFDLKITSGYLIRGYHVQAASVEQAEKKVRAIRQAACAVAIKARLTKLQDRREYGHIWVGLADSLAGGNCPSGSEQYRQQLSRELGGEIGGIRADALLARRRDTYTLRAVRAALVRSGHPLAEATA